MVCHGPDILDYETPLYNLEGMQWGLIVDEDIADSGDEAHGSHNHDDTTHDAIDEPEGTDVEMRPHLIDEPGDPKPPCHRSGKDR